MAKESQIAKWRRKPKYAVRFHNRCALCGRSRGYMGRFGICRICFRRLAHEGALPGVMKVSSS